MLETGKRDGELALLSRSEEINRQMEAALALQKALLGSVEAMTEETLDLRSRLSDAEASCCRLEQERDWLQQRLNHIQLAGARLVVNGLDHVSLRTQVWALQRWYQTARSERRERATFAHLKKIALSRLMAGRRYQRALQAWRAVAHAKRAVVHSFAVSNRARTRVAVVRRCYGQWRDGFREQRAMGRKLFIGRVGASFSAWSKWHVSRRARRRAEAVSTRKAVAKFMIRIVKRLFLQWAHDMVNRRESLQQKLVLMVQRGGVPVSGATASMSVVRGHYYATWKHRYLHKKRNTDIVRRLAAPRRIGTLRLCFGSLTWELDRRRKTKRATFKLNSRLIRAVLEKWADHCVWDAAVRRPIRLASARPRPHTQHDACLCVLWFHLPRSDTRARAQVRRAIFSRGLMRRDYLSRRRKLVHSFRLWLAVTEDVVIEREISSLRLREEELLLQQEEQHETHLLVVCVVCMRLMRFRFKLRAFRAWIKTALPWRVFTSVRRVRKVWPGPEGDASKVPWIPAGARDSTASPPPRSSSSGAHALPRSASATFSPIRRATSVSPAIPPYALGRTLSGSKDRHGRRRPSPSPTARRTSQDRVLVRASSQPDRAWMRGS